MEYIAQISTGGFLQPQSTSEEIIERLEFTETMIPVKSVIIGWNTDSSIYRKTGQWLHDHGKQMLLWLPVFAETGDLKETDEAVDLWNRPAGTIALSAGENFSFGCPSSERNIRNVIAIYEEYFSDCGFDGIFLDKIRTQSFAGGIGGVLSCGCSRCCSEYEKRGFHVNRFRNALEQRRDRMFDVQGYDPGSGFVMAEEMTAAFLKAKSEIITASIRRLCEYFKNQGLIVGLDLYAPLFSTFTGQDYETLAACAEFIKPMMYRRTDAPAGIGYEFEALKKAVPEAQGYVMPEMDAGFLRDQLNTFRSLPVKKYPGVEVNYREDIARTDPAYIAESLQVIRESGMDGAVLAWDIMNAPDSHLKAVMNRE